MNALQYAVNYIKRFIPFEVLDLAFMADARKASITTTLEKQIVDVYIEPWLLPDLNAIKAQSLTLNVNDCKIDHIIVNYSYTNLIITVPFTITGDRKIIRPVNLTIPVGERLPNDTTNAATKLITTMARYQHNFNSGFATSNLQLIAPNTILVEDNLAGIVQGFLDVEVELNKNLNHLSPGTFEYFGELALLGCKAYIYNKLIVRLEKGYIYNGHELGKVDETIQNYADADKDYKDYLSNVWGKVAYMNDTKDMGEYIKAMVNPML